MNSRLSALPGGTSHSTACIRPQKVGDNRLLMLPLFVIVKPPKQSLPQAGANGRQRSRPRRTANAFSRNIWGNEATDGTAAHGAQQKHLISPTDFRSPPQNSRSLMASEGKVCPNAVIR